MIYQAVRDLLGTQWTYTGGPNEAKAAEYYHDDAVLEFPQSGERFEGKASFTAWRQQYPARLDFEPRELRGGGDLWVAETGLRYDGGAPVSVGRRRSRTLRTARIRMWARSRCTSRPTGR